MTAEKRREREMRRTERIPRDGKDFGGKCDRQFRLFPALPPARLLHNSPRPQHIPPQHYNAIAYPSKYTESLQKPLLKTPVDLSSRREGTTKSHIFYISHLLSPYLLPIPQRQTHITFPGLDFYFVYSSPCHIIIHWKPFSVGSSIQPILLW